MSGVSQTRGAGGVMSSFYLSLGRFSIVMSSISEDVTYSLVGYFACCIVMSSILTAHSYVKYFVFHSYVKYFVFHSYVKYFAGGCNECYKMFCSLLK